MALALPAPIQWILEDDLSLKNAVEAGASLEALTKGAIQFSRRFTFRELQDRWYALLYNPGISTQSSAHMFELEISGINHSSKFNRSENNIKGNKGILQKRKSESIRRKYYAMRKKIRNKIFSKSDIGFLEPNPQNRHFVDFQEQVRRDGNPLSQDCMLGNNISDLLGLQEEQIDFFQHALTVTSDTNTTNVPQTDCPNSLKDTQQERMMGSYGVNENASSSLQLVGNTLLEAIVENRQIPLISENNISNENSHISSVGFEDRQKVNFPNPDDFASLQTIMFAPDQPETAGTGMGDTAQVEEGIICDGEGREDNSAGYTCEFADPDSLLNLSIEDGIPLVNAKDKSFISNVNPDCLDSQKDGGENEAKKVELENTTSQTSSVPFPCGNPVVLNVVAQSDNAYEQINVPIKPASDSDFAEVLNVDKICCTLNTEDTEIPCNDDIFLLIHPFPSFGGFATPPNATVSSSADNQRVMDLPSKTKVSTKAFGWTPKGKTQGLLESHSVNPIVGEAAKTELRSFRPQSLLPGFASKISTKGNSVHAIPKVPNKCNRLVEKDIVGRATRPAIVIEVCGKMVPQESVVDFPVSDEEEFQMDDDVPYFSDIEALILEMDLDPYDQDSQVIKQAPIYQHDETKKTIIRLEQGARSYLERAMTLHGAFAILYGRHLRYYITKPEVLLGRSTDEIDVDVDLGKEGRANKISRRQRMIFYFQTCWNFSLFKAIIKMEADGSFFIKNIGKSSISVNGMSIAPRQLLTLSSSCLIEIRGMNFVFEINQRYVKKYLGDIFKKK